MLTFAQPILAKMLLIHAANTYQRTPVVSWLNQFPQTSVRHKCLPLFLWLSLAQILSLATHQAPNNDCAFGAAVSKTMVVRKVLSSFPNPQEARCGISERQCALSIPSKEPWPFQLCRSGQKHKKKKKICVRLSCMPPITSVTNSYAMRKK